MASMKDKTPDVGTTDQARPSAEQNPTGRGMAEQVAANQGAAGRRRVPRWMVPLIAVVGALLVWAIGQLAGVGEVAVDTGAAVQTVVPASVVAASLAAGLAGWGARALIGRVVRSVRGAQTIWLVLSGVVLLGSLLGVGGAVTTGALVVLLAEHVTVGLILMLGLRR